MLLKVKFRRSFSGWKAPGQRACGDATWALPVPRSPEVSLALPEPTCASCVWHCSSWGSGAVILFCNCQPHGVDSRRNLKSHSAHRYSLLSAAFPSEGFFEDTLPCSQDFPAPWSYQSNTGRKNICNEKVLFQPFPFITIAHRRSAILRHPQGWAWCFEPVTGVLTVLSGIGIPRP